jgi:tRNA-dihydrouridine synthase 1
MSGKAANFFQSLGSPQKIVAPMVDHSGLAYRMLCRKYGATLVYTQMFHARMFVESEEYRKNNFQTCHNDRPLIVQFCGKNLQSPGDSDRLMSS